MGAFVKGIGNVALGGSRKRSQALLRGADLPFDSPSRAASAVPSQAIVSAKPGPTPARRRLNIPLNTAGRGSSGLQI
jgi:hypothetical protein